MSAAMIPLAAFFAGAILGALAAALACAAGTADRNSGDKE